MSPLCFTEEELMKRKELFDKYHIVQISDGRWRAFKDGKTLRYTSLSKLLDVVSVDQTSISSIWDEFIDYKKDFSRPGTIENYNRLYETFIKPSSIYEKPLTKISVHDIKCFFKE